MSDTSPKTNEKLEDNTFRINHDKRGSILKFLDKHPELYDGDEVYLPKSWIAECVMAIKRNQPELVQRWLDKDRRLLTRKLEGDFTALHLACEFSSPELVDTLLKILKQRNQSIMPGAAGFKPIHLNVLLEKALKNDEYSKCELLLKLGAEIEQPEAFTQNTLLHRMVINGNQAAANWLFEQKIILESCNREGNTPLLLSVIQGKIEPIDFLLLMNANLEAENVRKETPLYIAVEKGDVKAARLILAHGADPTVSYGTAQLNILHIAARHGDLEMLMLLLKTKAASFINAPNADGDTPLHLAANAGKDNAILLLLETGADHKITNYQEQTPIELARQQNKIKIANLIVQTARVLKKAKLDEVGVLRQLIKKQSTKIEELQRSKGEQSVKIEQLQAACMHEKKGSVEIKRQFEHAKKIAITHLYNFKKINKQSIKDPLIKNMGKRDNTRTHCIQYLGGGQLARSLDGTPHNDHIIDIWDIKNGSCLKILQGHTGSVYCLKYLPSGELVSGSNDKSIKIWDLESGACLKTLQGHSDGVYSLEYLSNGKLISGSRGTMKLWDLKSGNCIKTLQTQENDNYISCLQRLPSGGIAIRSSSDGLIKIWDLEKGICVKTLQGHTDRVLCLQLLPSGELISGSQDRTIKIWNLESGICLKTLQEHAEGVSCIEFLPGGEIVSGSRDQTIKIWDLESGICLKTLLGHGGMVTGLQYFPSGELVTSSYDSGIRTWVSGTRSTGCND